MGTDRSTMFSGSLQLAWKLLQTTKTLVLALTFILHHHQKMAAEQSSFFPQQKRIRNRKIWSFIHQEK